MLIHSSDYPWLTNEPTTPLELEKSTKRRCGLRDEQRTPCSILVCTKGFVLDTIDNVYPHSKRGDIPQKWIDGVEWQDIERHDPPDEFWRTLVANRGLDGRNPPTYYSRACKEACLKGGLPGGSVSTSDLINNERSPFITQFCRRVQAVVWHRSLIKTTSNIGLASQNVSRGDIVCILFGCSVPVVLRRCAKRKTIEQLVLERQVDFLDMLTEVQLNWKRRFERRRRRRVLRTSDASAHDNNVTGRKSPQPTSRAEKRSTQLATVEAWDEHYYTWLHRLPDNSEDDSYYYYQLLGEAYIHGMIDGAAIQYQSRNRIPTQLFELR